MWKRIASNNGQRKLELERDGYDIVIRSEQGDSKSRIRLHSDEAEELLRWLQNENFLDHHTHTPQGRLVWLK